MENVLKINIILVAVSFSEIGLYLAYNSGSGVYLIACFTFRLFLHQSIYYLVRRGLHCHQDQDGDETSDDDAKHH